MKIKEITSRMRRDFSAVYECEHCGETHCGDGYDDSYFHNIVIPAMKCQKCGKTASQDYKAMHPRYSAEVVV